MKRTRTSKAWMREHVNDSYVKRATAEGYRSRAAYKLIEIDRRDHLFRRGATVVDLGAAPGGWSQVAVRAAGPGGCVVAVDVLEMPALAGVHFIRGDFRDPDCVMELRRTLAGREIDLVLSDMSPNISGIAGIDQARICELAGAACEFAGKYLKPQGIFLVKLFNGEGFEAFRESMREVFGQIHVRKPDASRDRSREVYLLGKNRHSDALNGRDSNNED
ncbi:MAG TPA: RlmE family RNA methyltransferase [Burkholderiales bacterium]|jgi:23S rRNA (uridine2552-2'-O)-methyltransferase|nr:RlmE family RNA methyltransferase [Burkholderiales bacterium]